MKTQFIESPTEAKKFVYFSNFKNSKRIRWSESRHFAH